MIGQRKLGRNAPYKWFKLPGGHDSLFETTLVCLSTCTLSPLNTLLASQLSISLWKFISTKPTGQGFVTVHWFYWSSGDDSGLSLPYPDFNSWLRNQSPASNHCGLWPPKFKDTATSQQSATWKTVFTRTWPSWHPDLKFSAHRTVRNKFVSKKWLSLWYCYSSLNGQRQ